VYSPAPTPPVSYADAAPPPAPTAVPSWVWLAAALWVLKAAAGGAYVYHKIHAR